MMNGANDKELTYGEVQVAKREMEKDSIEDINWTEKCFKKKDIKTFKFEAVKSESYDSFNLYDVGDNKAGILNIPILNINKKYIITISEVNNSK